MKLSLTSTRFTLLLMTLAWSAFSFAAESSSTSTETLSAPIEQKNYAPFPQPDRGYVSDLADLLTYEEEERIEQWLWQVESASQVEIIVFTVDSLSDYPRTPNQSIESFATALFDTYGIGNMPKNDGVLFLIARQDRQARIELGAGWGRLRDGEAQRIMSDVILPEFRDGDYAAGVTDGTEAIINEFAEMRVGFPWYMALIIGGSITCFLIGISLIKSGKRGWGYVFIGLAIVLLLLFIFLAVRIVKHMPKSDSSGWSSGGAGGFGGGFSGGGGATGSW